MHTKSTVVKYIDNHDHLCNNTPNRSNKVITAYQGQPSVIFMLLSQLTRAHQTILANARTTAGRFAELGKPDKNEKHVLPYIRQIHSAYSSLLATVHTNLGTTTTHQIGKINHQITTANKKRLQKDLRQLQEVGRQEKLDGGVPDYTEVKIRLVFALLLSGLLHIGETFFNISAFQVFGDMWLASAAFAFALSIALFCWSHALPVFVKREVEKRRKILVAVGGIGIVTVIFTVLGLLRSQMLALHTEQSVSAVYFVLLNLFVFIASAVVSYFLLPEWEAIKALIQSHKKQRQQHQRQQAHKALTQQEKLFDITNPNQQNKSVLSEQGIQKISAQIEADKWSRHQFKIRYIGDVLYTESLFKNLASAKPTTSNIYLRNSLIKNYIKHIQQDIQEAQNLPFDKNHSLVFETITHELQLLRQSPAARKTLIITSDLMENSTWLSLYEPENYHLLFHETERIFKLYKERFEPMDLSEIEVYFTYQANDYQEGKTYEKLVHIYRKLLEENGAKVHIGSL